MYFSSISLLAVFPIFNDDFTNALAVHILTLRIFSCLYTSASATYTAAFALFTSERVFVYNAQVGSKVVFGQRFAVDCCGEPRLVVVLTGINIGH